MLWPIGQPFGELARPGAESLRILARGPGSRAVSGTIGRARCTWPITTTRRKCSRSSPSRAWRTASARIARSRRRFAVGHRSSGRTGCGCASGVRRGLRRPARGRRRLAAMAIAASMASRSEFDTPVARSRRRRHSIAGVSDSRRSRSGSAAGTRRESSFPNCSREVGLVRCKLQMMRSQPRERRVPDRPDAGRRPDAPALRRRFGTVPRWPRSKTASPESRPGSIEMGIHVLVSQNGRGELTIGDSHEYGDEIEPFDKARDRRMDPRLSRDLPRRPRVADRLAMARDLREASGRALS